MIIDMRIGGGGGRLKETGEILKRKWCDVISRKQWCRVDNGRKKQKHVSFPNYY